MTVNDTQLLNEILSLKENDIYTLGGRIYEIYQGVLKGKEIVTSSAQEQTQSTFGFKWSKEDTFDSIQSLSRMKSWLLERYLEPQDWLKKIKCKQPVVLDAGCGAGMSGFEYWGNVAELIHYVGIDVSTAVYTARKRASNKGFKQGIFIQESIDNLPFHGPMFDIVFSEGVLHHTDNTENTFAHLCRLLKSEGLFMFYIYRKKGPIREFTDDYIREKLQTLSPQQGWEALEGLTKLGIELGNLNVEVNVPKEIEFLGIPAGKINLQRLFYWYVFKAFYDPKLSFDEMHHINFDWYAPKNAHRHTIEEVKSWCANNQMRIEHIKEELAGITCIARKQ